MWLMLIVLVTCLLFYSRKKLQYFSTKGVRTLPPVPLLGNLTAVTFGRENFVEAIANGYNAFKDERYFGLYQYLVPTLIPRDPDLIRQIMVRDFHAFADRGVHIGTDCDPMFGKNLIMLRGSTWRSMRSAISPAFSASRCRGMAPLMAESADAVLQYLRSKVLKEELMDVNQITTAYVNDVIASCAFGFAVNSLKDPDNCIFKLSQKAIVQDTTQVMKFFGYENMKSIMKFLDVKIIKASDAEQFSQLFKSALTARRQNLAQPRPDFIQTLVDAAQGKLKEAPEAEGNNNEDKSGESKSESICSTVHSVVMKDEVQSPSTLITALRNAIKMKFTDDDLVAQAVLFYVAGYDTTANLVNYFLYEMAANPHIQEKLQAELDSAGDLVDLYDFVQDLEYLDMCVSEVLRLWPLVGSADRRSVQPYDFGLTYPGSKHRLIAPAGIHVWLPIYSIHRDEKYWPQPDQCDPERFSADNKAKITPYTYLPFGTGPRHCIGSRFAVLTAKVFLTKFFRAYSTRAPRASRRLCPRAFILRPKEGFSVIVQRR